MPWTWNQVSEQHIAPIFRVEELYFFTCFMLISCLLYSSALKTEPAVFLRKSVTYHGLLTLQSRRAPSSCWPSCWALAFREFPWKCIHSLSCWYSKANCASPPVTVKPCVFLHSGIAGSCVWLCRMCVCEGEGTDADGNMLCCNTSDVSNWSALFCKQFLFLIVIILASIRKSN